MPSGKQRGGRPRDSRLDHAVLRAAREILAEDGYAGLTMDAVAARAVVSRAAIYRRYASKAELAFAATVHGSPTPQPADTGSLRGDLHELARGFHLTMATPAARQLAPALMADLAQNPDLAARFRQTVLAAERAQFAVVIDRAVARGELARPVDPARAHLLLAGPHVAALYAFHDPVDEELLGDLATAAAAGIAALAT